MVGILIDLIMHLFWDLVAVHDFDHESLEEK